MRSFLDKASTIVEIGGAVLMFARPLTAASFFCLGVGLVALRLRGALDDVRTVGVAILPLLSLPVLAVVPVAFAWPSPPPKYPVVPLVCCVLAALVGPIAALVMWRRRHFPLVAATLLMLPQLVFIAALLFAAVSAVTGSPV